MTIWGRWVTEQLNYITKCIAGWNFHMYAIEYSIQYNFTQTYCTIHRCTSTHTTHTRTHTLHTHSLPVYLLSSSSPTSSWSSRRREYHIFHTAHLLPTQPSTSTKNTHPLNVISYNLKKIYNSRLSYTVAYWPSYRISKFWVLESYNSWVLVYLLALV